MSSMRRKKYVDISLFFVAVFLVGITSARPNNLNILRNENLKNKLSDVEVKNIEEHDIQVYQQNKVKHVVVRIDSSENDIVPENLSDDTKEQVVSDTKDDNTDVVPVPVATVPTDVNESSEEIDLEDPTEGPEEPVDIPVDVQTENPSQEEQIEPEIEDLSPTQPIVVAEDPEDLENESIESNLEEDTPVETTSEEIDLEEVIPPVIPAEEELAVEEGKKDSEETPAVTEETVHEVQPDAETIEENLDSEDNVEETIIVEPDTIEDKSIEPIENEEDMLGAAITEETVTELPIVIVKTAEEDTVTDSPEGALVPDTEPIDVTTITVITTEATTIPEPEATTTVEVIVPEIIEVTSVETTTPAPTTHATTTITTPTLIIQTQPVITTQAKTEPIPVKPKIKKIHKQPVSKPEVEEQTASWFYNADGSWTWLAIIFVLLFLVV